MPGVTILDGPPPLPFGSAVEVEVACRAVAAGLGLTATFRRSNHEGDLVDWIHQEGAAVQAGRSIGAVLNQGALSSVALHDAIVEVGLPVVEVRLSTDGALRRGCPAARGLIAGFGVHGYVLAIRALALF
ncbi:3-dehydroquinate dehydratase 1 [Asanoa ishikariensis]|uniref:3-dehydroquinate dehydratase n=1 Tax=Asanoa ishikariensis TaxID=137265 RepID=A0A1H3T469_9ACTN|nr:type II 3-dehydroquinate dehydratase [Asanoa ishikariensis]GIF63041.1 3-dehydroquinate dehydratase 1 [Asanoa ishikariensis]SDZ44840.1 3-dehydroquinate dehydratase [Asanoa ishikariensis]